MKTIACIALFVAVAMTSLRANPNPAVSESPPTAAKLPAEARPKAGGKSWFDTGVQKNALGVAVNGNVAYVADGPFGVQVVDISNPVHMRHLAHVDIGGYAKDGIQVRGNLVYALNSGWKTSELVLIDVTSPAQPVIVGRVSFPGMGWGLDVSGDHVFVGADGEGLVVIDASVPSHPAVAGWAKCKKALGVQVVGQRAYLAAWNEGVIILDVRDPKNPTRMGKCGTPGSAYSVCVHKQTAYVAANQEGLQILDISDPSQCRLLGSYKSAANASRPYGASDVVVKDGLAFLTDIVEGLTILDVSNPARPAVLAKSGASPCFGAKLEGDRVYVAAHGEGLLTFEIGGWRHYGSEMTSTAPYGISPLGAGAASTSALRTVMTGTVVAGASGVALAPPLELSTLKTETSFKVTWQSSREWRYTVLIATNDLSSWSPVPEFADLPGTGGLMTRSVEMTQPRQFFRVAARRDEAH